MGPRKPLRKIFLAAVLAVSAAMPGWLPNNSSNPNRPVTSSASIPSSAFTQPVCKTPATTLHIIDSAMDTDYRGNKFWFNARGQVHRNGGPAIETTNGEKQWYRNGVLDRADGPAVEKEHYSAWYRDGKLHRTDGPAVVYKNGLIKEWHVNGYQLTEGEFNALEVFGYPAKSLPLGPCV